MRGAKLNCVTKRQVAMQGVTMAWGLHLMDAQRLVGAAFGSKFCSAGQVLNSEAQMALGLVDLRR